MGKLHQAHTSITCSLGSMLVGLLFVWPSYTLQLYQEGTTVLSSPMSGLESSLVGSLPPLGAMVGTLGAGWIISTFGRQKSGVVIVAPIVISWIMIDFTMSSIVILIARFMSGFSAGALMVYSPIYISEVVEESIRGALASAPIACYCIGTLVSYILGWFLTYRYIIWTNLALCFIYIGLIMTVTESPVFLMSQNREEEACLAIAHYRSVSVNSKMVLDEISRLKQLTTPAVELIAVNTDEKVEDTEKEKLNKDIEEVEPPKKKSPFIVLFTSPSSRRAFTVVGMVLTIQVMMGMVAVQVYAKDIFTQAAPSLSSHFCSVMFAFVLFSGSLLSALFADRFGRKFLLISSSVVVCLCLAGMGMLLHTSIAPAWVTAVLILCYCFAFMFGAGSVPYVLLAESFVPEVQSIGCRLLMLWVWFLNFALIAIFPYMIKFFTIHGSFYIFASFAILDIAVGIFIVPETKGLTKVQIQEAFLRRRNK